MYGPRPIRFPAHWCADHSKYRGFLAGGISTASSLILCFGTRLRRQNFNLAPTQYRQLRRLKLGWLNQFLGFAEWWLFIVSLNRMASLHLLLWWDFFLCWWQGRFCILLKLLLEFFYAFEPSITSYNAKQLEKVVFLPAYLYKERVSKALSFVIGCTHFMHTFYPTRPFRHVVQVTVLREETLHRMSCQSEISLFSVYSHVNTDFKITVPLKRNITQITSTYS